MLLFRTQSSFITFNLANTLYKRPSQKAAEIPYPIKIDANLNTNCVVLHPSALPKYRGGSPIQNQIINGVTNSMVSFIKMNEGIDEGDIIYQTPLNLSGKLDDIFTNIIELSAPIILAIILQYFYLERFVTQKQNDENASYYPRRTADMSEIKINDFNLFSALELHNKIRSLQDPYPNAYIKCKDNSFLYIIESKISG